MEFCFAFLLTLPMATDWFNHRSRVPLVHEWLRRLCHFAIDRPRLCSRWTAQDFRLQKSYFKMTESASAFRHHFLLRALVCRTREIPHIQRINPLVESINHNLMSLSLRLAPDFRSNSGVILGMSHKRFYRSGELAYAGTFGRGVFSIEIP